MRMIFFVCAGEAVKPYVIPDRPQSPSESGYTVNLNQESLPIVQSIELKLFLREETWYFEEDRDRHYQIYHEAKPFIRQPIKGNTIYHIKTIHRDQLWILACTDVCICEAHMQYSIAKLSQITIGKATNNTIQYNHADFVSSLHAVIQRDGKECVLIDKSTNGTYINGMRVSGSRKLSFSDTIWICGLQLIFLNQVLAVKSYSNEPVINLQRYSERMDEKRVVKTQFETGKNLFHRSPRAVQYIDCETIELEAPPNLREYVKQPLLLAIGPSLTMAIPMLLGFAIMAYTARLKSQSSNSFMYMGLITSIASGILGTIWALVNVHQNKQRYQEDEMRRRTAYENYLVGCEEKIREKYEHNTNAMRSMYPSAGTCCTYDEQTHVLWNRNVMHEDFLMHRFGTGEALFQAKVQIPKERFQVMTDDLPELPKQLMKKYHTLYNVPICVDLGEHRLIGCIGNNDRGGQSEIMRILMAQIAANHPYSEVKTVFLLDNRFTVGGEDRGYVRWFPHVWSEDKKMRYVDFGEGQTEEVLYELSRILRLRLEQKQSLPHYILFIEQYKRFEGELIEKYIFSKAEECGVTVILFAAVYEELPNSCTYIIQNDSYFAGIYDIRGTKELRQAVSPDPVSIAEISAFARRLSGIEINETHEGAQIPDSLTLFDLLDIKQPNELYPEENWKTSRPDMHLKVPIGKKSGNNTCYLDIHEKAHGPHGLIAGMTGSGKSELLQTYIISMAVRYSPEEIGFFLIDYKGGGMANLFADLPHVVGSISNLSGSIVKRAMVSIKSENRRRQELFQKYGVNNIQEYFRSYRANEVNVPMPHILIIIDEFAELKKEEPEFMKELISVAQVGRSLGVHLILATQKPGGTVDDNIRSNARFRLCLRVQDRQDSSEMLHKADAAYLTRAGRAYLQVGNDELYEMFQTAWSGAVYESEREQYLGAAQLIDLSGRREQYAKKKVEQEDTVFRNNLQKKTQLEAVIEQVKKAALQMNGFHKTILWLPVLPSLLSLTEMDITNDPLYGKEFHISVPVGKYDQPGRQRQDTLFLRLTEGGHHVICGMVTSGKSTFLQTAVYALLCRYSANEVNIYIIDYSSQMLSAFSEAPQVGAFIGENDIGTIKRLFMLISDVMKERKALLQGGTFRQYIQTIAMLPSIVLVIDQMAMFKEKTDGIFENELLELSRIGEAYGIYLMVTAGGIGGAELSNRIADNFRTAVCLEMSDKYQYAGVLHVTRTEVIPEAGVKGRGLAIADGEILEFQTALALSETDDYIRMERIAQECSKIADKWGTDKPWARKIACIPEQLRQKDFLQYEEVKNLMKTREVLPIGYFTETAHVCSLDLRRIYCFLITGGSKTGKSMLMKNMMQTAEALEAKVIVIKKDENTEEVFKMYEQLSDLFRMRNSNQKEIEKQQKYFIFIEDFVSWVTWHYKDIVLQRAEPLIQNLIEKGSNHNVYFIAEYDTRNYAEVAGRGIYKAFADYKTGIHFGGRVDGQRIFDYSYLSYSEQDKSLGAGIGLIPDMGWGENEYGKVVIPKAEEDSERR